VKGLWSDPIKLAESSPRPIVEKDTDIEEHMQWAPEDQFDLAPGQSHRVSISVSQGSALVAQAQWHDSTAPLRLTLSKDGQTLATGTPVKIPPDRGFSTVHLKSAATANITVVVTNDAAVSVSVRLNAATVALSELGVDK
jgi:hypothetical protein